MDVIQRQDQIRIMFMILSLILICVFLRSVYHTPTPANIKYNKFLGGPILRNLQQNNDRYTSLDSVGINEMENNEPRIQTEESAKLDGVGDFYKTQQERQQLTEITTMQLMIHQEQEKKLYIMSETIVCATIEEYLNALGEMNLNNTILFYWNSTGSLMNSSPRAGQPKKGWVKDDEVQMLFSQTKPSKYGTAALLFNSDIIRAYNWQLIPPVPVMFYTLPKELVYPDSKFIVIPNRYDRVGFSERQIHLVQAYLKETNNNDGSVTLDEFSKRKNTIIWRGAIRNQKDRKLLTMMSADDSINRDGWLDAFDSSGNSPTHMAIETMADQYRYQIDIGGCSGTSWDGLRWKMCASGGVVFKVDTFAVDWWHNDLVPWKHYIPVKADLSDLREQYDWAEQNLNEAYEIAVAGRNLCSRSYTKESARQMMIHIVQDLPPLISQDLYEESKKLFDQKIPKILFNHSYS